MKNFKLSTFIDFIFINLLIFLIFFTWFKFFNRNILLSAFLSLLITFGYNILKIFFTNNKKNKIKISKNLEDDLEMYMFTLLSNSKEENLNFFNKIFSKYDSLIDIKNNRISYKKDNDIINIYPMFNTKYLNFEDCLKKISISKKNNTNTILFLCYASNNKEKTLLQQITNVKIKIYEKKDIFVNIFKKFEIYPEINFTIKENKKIKFKQLLEISFNKTRTKSYFLSGLFIFFCSFIVKYNIYYVFMSSLLFFFSLLSFIKKDNATEKDLLFD